MRDTRKQVEAHVDWINQILCSVGCGNGERSAFEPVTIGIVHFHDLGVRTGSLAPCEHAISLARERVGKAGVGERKDLFRINVAPALERGAVGLRKPMIEKSSTSPIDIRHHAVENLPPLLILVEPEIQERSMEPPGL